MHKIFILGLGRTGTKFLSNLLDYDPKAYIQHEPFKLDKKYIFYRYTNSFNTITDQLMEDRFKKILSCIENPEKYEIYGEVNSYLRYEVDWLRSKGWQCFFIVRDGRDYITSAYSRNVFTDNELGQAIIPMDNDVYADKWNVMDRFEKLCWYWNHTNSYLLTKFDSFINIEKIFNDYDYLDKKLLTPAGLNISRQDWLKARNNPKNTSRKRLLKKRIKSIFMFRSESFQKIQTIPSYNKWSPEKKKKFWDICGRTMKELGYENNTLE